MQELINQIVSRIPELTQEQVDRMNSAFLPIPEIVEADAVAGEATALAMAQLADDVDAGVYAVARTGILGICASGLVAPETCATLVRVWTDIVEPLDEGTADEEVGGVETTGETSSEPVVETPHVPTEEELADLAKVGDTGSALPPLGGLFTAKFAPGVEEVPTDEVHTFRKVEGQDGMGLEFYELVPSNGGLWLAENLTDLQPYPASVNGSVLENVNEEGDINV